MYRVAIVEDEWESFESIRKCFEEYTKEYGEAFNIIRFKNGMYFLGAYSSNFDVVIMDIDMPQMNGIQTAADLRKVDDKVVLIFVTFLAKYAIKGYAVDALDYVVKPVNYHTFKLKIARAIERCRKNARGRVFLPTSEGEIGIDIDRLDYIEISGHTVFYHTQSGVYKAYGTMKGIEERLPERQFFKCNRCYLVNLHSVVKLEGNVVSVGSDKLVISRTRRKAFVDALASYVMGEA